MLHGATFLPDSLPDVNGPFPSRLVGCAANGHSTDMNQFKFALFEFSHFVRPLKSLENHLKHTCTSPFECSRFTMVRSSVWQSASARCKIRRCAPRPRNARLRRGAR